MQQIFSNRVILHEVMKLSLPIIVENCNFRALSALPENASKEMRLGRPVLLTDETVLKADTLYIAYGSALPGYIDFEEGCALICLGSPDKTVSKRPLDELWILDKNEDIDRVYKAVNRLFDLCDTWEEALKTGKCSFLLALIRPKEGALKMRPEQLSSQLSDRFPFILAFVRAGNVMAVINTSEIKKDSGKIFAELEKFLSENSLRIGLSNSFSDFNKINDYLKETEAALNYGLKYDPEKNIYAFADYVPYYISGKIIEEFPSEELFPALYYRLKHYDEANHTDYLHTLIVYLENDMNAVQAANALFIHRATIIYRLKKICEIGQTDLKNKTELLHLRLMLTLTELEKPGSDSPDNDLNTPLPR